MKTIMRRGGGLLMLLAAACGTGSRIEDAVTTPGTSGRRVPLPDLGRGEYLGFPGGLYPGGNVMPTAHATAGLLRAVAIEPLDEEGRPSSRGRYVLLSIGMSNTTQEFCSQGSEVPWVLSSERRNISAMIRATCSGRPGWSVNGRATQGI